MGEYVEREERSREERRKAKNRRFAEKEARR